MYFYTFLSPPVKYFTDRSKALLLLWTIFVFCLVFVMPLCASVYLCIVVRQTSWLSFVVSNCEIGILGQVWYLIV